MSSLNNGRLWPVAGVIDTWTANLHLILLARFSVFIGNKSLRPCPLMVRITGVRLEEAGVQGRDSYPFLMLESTEGRSLALRHTDIALAACHICPPLLQANLRGIGKRFQSIITHTPGSR